ncbi:MAG: hypothetical protein ACPGQV_22760, partial [Alphaproteobacteria bacterium]
MNLFLVICPEISGISRSHQELYYLLEWEALADPNWIEMRAGIEADGAIVDQVESLIGQPTSFLSVNSEYDLHPNPPPHAGEGTSLTGSLE